jgi:hypothetical protein
MQSHPVYHCPVMLLTHYHAIFYKCFLLSAAQNSQLCLSKLFPTLWPNLEHFIQFRTDFFFFFFVVLGFELRAEIGSGELCLGWL